jgi:hypothetical protein
VCELHEIKGPKKQRGDKKMASYLINNVGINTTTRVEAESLSVEANVVKFLASQKGSRRARSCARRLVREESYVPPKQEPR